MLLPTHHRQAITGHGDIPCSAFHAAAYCGNIRCLELLLELPGANVNDANDEGDGETALTCTIDKGMIETALFLVRAGADINVTDDYGISALQRAAESWADDSHLLVAALLAAGAPIQPARGGTLLGWAASGGQSPETAALLIAAGVPVDARNSRRETALLNIGGANGDVRPNHRFILTLLAAGADANAADRWGRTAAHGWGEGDCKEERDGLTDSLQELLLWGYRIDAECDEGLTPSEHLGDMFSNPNVPPAALLAFGCPWPRVGRAPEPSPLIAGRAVAIAARSFASFRSVSEAAVLQGAAAALEQRLALAAAASAPSGGSTGEEGLSQLRLLLSGALPADGEAWWEQDKETRPMRYAAVLQERAVRAAVVQSCAERALAEASVRSLAALQHWQQEHGRRGDSGDATAGASSPSPAGGVQQSRRPRSSAADAAANGSPPLAAPRGDKLTWAAAMCIAKWASVGDALRQAKQAAAAQADALVAARDRAETTLAELQVRVAAMPKQPGVAAHLGAAAG